MSRDSYVVRNLTQNQCLHLLIISLARRRDGLPGHQPRLRRHLLRYRAPSGPGFVGQRRSEGAEGQRGQLGRIEGGTEVVGLAVGVEGGGRPLAVGVLADAILLDGWRNGRRGCRRESRLLCFLLIGRGQSEQGSLHGRRSGQEA